MLSLFQRDVLDEIWDTISILIITMGHNSIDLVHGVTVLVLCISSDHGLHLY